MQFRAEHSEICKKFVYEKCAYFAWRKYVENMLEPRLQQIKSRGAFNTFWCSGVLSAIAKSSKLHMGPQGHTPQLKAIRSLS